MLRFQTRLLVSFCFIFIVFGAQFSRAQNASIKGRVLEGSEPAIAADVALYRGDAFIAGSVTDDNGIFYFDQLPTGTYWIVVTYSEFSEKVENIVVKANQSIKLSDLIISENTDIADKTWDCQRLIIFEDETTHSHSFSRDEIARMPR